MTPVAFVAALPLAASSAPSLSRLRRAAPPPPPPRRAAPTSPLASLASLAPLASLASLASLRAQLRSAAAVACAAVALGALPLRSAGASPLCVDPASHAPAAAASARAQQRLPRAASVPVVGVAKRAIHDYAPPARAREPRAARGGDGMDEARGEICLAARLITAVLLGATVGVERSATTLNLGVRSVTLISLCSAVASVVAASVPAVPHAGGARAALGVLLVSATAALAVFAAAKLRRPRPNHIGAMSAIVALAVAMGTACGYGLSLITIVSCLAAIYVMRQPYASAARRARASAASTGGDARVVQSRDRAVQIGAAPAVDAYSAPARAEGVDA